MNTQTTRRWATRVATVGAVAATIAFGLLLAPAEAAPPGPLDNPTLRSVCSNCHTLDRIERQSLDRAGWEAIMTRMREYMESAGGTLGTLTDEQSTEVLDHLGERARAALAVETHGQPQDHREPRRDVALALRQLAKHPAPHLAPVRQNQRRQQ